MSAPDPDELARGPVDETDVAVLATLARVVRATDPVPGGLVERSILAMSLARMDAELLTIVADELPAGAVRAERSSTASTVTFTSDALSLMIDISAVGGRVRLDGWVAPARDLVVALHRAGEPPRTTRCDADGRFVLLDVPHGLAGLVLAGAADGRPRLTTPVIEL